MKSSSPWLRTLGGIAVFIWLLFVGSGSAGAASAAERCRLERVLTIHGRASLLSDVATIAGLAMPYQDPSSFELFLNGRTLGRATRVRRVAGELTTHVVIAVQLTSELAAAMPALRLALPVLLRALPVRSSVAILRFGGDVLRPPALVPRERALAELPEMDADDSRVVQLGKALQLSTELLRRAREASADPASSRQIVIVIGSGDNSIMERNYFRQLGDEILDAGVSVFPIGLASQQQAVGNLLHLGELARRTGGTFRWAREPAELSAAAAALAEQLRSTLVLEFGGDTAEQALRRLDGGAAMWLQCSGRRSNTLRRSAGHATAAPRARQDSPGGGTTLVLSLVVILGAAGGVSGWLVARKRRSKSPATALPSRQEPWSIKGPWLEPLAGPGESPPIHLNQSVILGSEVAGDVHRLVGDGAISARHCSVALTAEGLLLTDLRSTNGTRVNGQRVARPTLLRQDDIVAIGNFTQFRVRGISAR